jgi:signal transduction histidine kinase
MFLWIRDQRWLPTITLASVCLLLFGGSDLLIQGPKTFPAALVLAASVALSRPLPYISMALFSVGLFIPLLLGLQPQISQLGTTVSLLILSSFASTQQRWVGFGLNLALGSVSFLYVIITAKVNESLYGLSLPTESAKFALAIAGLLAMIAINANAWFVGRLLHTRMTHVGTDSDQALLTLQLAQAQLALAEQDRRFGIARDVNDLLLEQISSTMSEAEAGIYSGKSEPSVAARISEKVLDGVRKSYAEIRRLSDLLELQQERALALPGLRDLNALVVSFRESGFKVTFRQAGTPLKLNSGAELVLYRIVSEALANIKQHTPIGTSVDIDLNWHYESLQLVIKDNGEQTQRELDENKSGYTPDDDQIALVQRPTGAGITTMQERVALYEGTLDLVSVPGVGFTLSASFPFIARYSEGN